MRLCYSARKLDKKLANKNLANLLKLILSFIFIIYLGNSANETVYLVLFHKSGLNNY